MYRYNHTGGCYSICFVGNRLPAYPVSLSGEQFWLIMTIAIAAGILSPYLVTCMGPAV